MVKIAKAVGIALVSAMAVAAAGPALALPDEYVWRTYFSDETYMLEVGEYHLLCSGRTVRRGQETPYYQTYTAPCPNPPHSGPW